MTLEVKESSEEDIQVGDKVLVPINAPKEDEFDDGVVQVFHRRDVIRIL
jgi:co-chaperonin GroES (HSP10)